ncbi:phosphatidylinositol synthase 1 (CDP-alcohol phosphatidyltransferase1) [Coemansia sp. IMI 203386]|nr:phosphatidylinositol synthase 1 (CDP-alcohol phosphatidyltransferase1) [Coemansia sp. IMI 203386]
MDVFWFVPNLIGYSRVALTGVAAYSMYNEHPTLMFLSYALSELLDAADGHYARKLNQCSKFGEVLDMMDKDAHWILKAYYTDPAFPICVIKNGINVIQLYESAKDLAKLDAASLNNQAANKK